MQLNILQRSNTTPNILVFNHLVQHDFNATPFRILGTKVETHVMTRQLKSWEIHTKMGYYLGSAWKHYCYNNKWVKETKSTRIGQIVFFKHKCITAPHLTETDAIAKASEELAQLLDKTTSGQDSTKRRLTYSSAFLESK